MPEIQALAQEIADKFGGTVSAPNLKSKVRIVEKASNEYGGDVSQVKDIARNTTALPADKIEAAIAEYERRKLPAGSTGSGITQIKRQMADTDPLGYSGTIIRYRSSHGKMVGEMQINTPDMIYAKEKPQDALAQLGEQRYHDMVRKYPNVKGGQGHLIYEERRSLLSDPVKNAERIKQLDAQSRAYYQNFRK